MKSLLGFLALGLISCVPKTQFEDQQAKLAEAQARLKSLEYNTAECDTDMFMQLREQAQSLDLLTQELVDRNTELSREVARLKVYESQTHNEDLNCEKRMADSLRECELRVTRTRSTYEDLIKGLRVEISRLKEMILKNARKPQTSSKSNRKAPDKATADSKSEDKKP